jgi:hypothetical protein
MVRSLSGQGIEALPGAVAGVGEQVPDWFAGGTC